MTLAQCGKKRKTTGQGGRTFSLDEIIFGATLSQLSQTRPLIRRIIERAQPLS